jgi:serine/threonine protein kinase
VGVKLVNLGICATVGSPDAGEDGHFLGTPAYVAPERLIDAQVDGAADVHALGVLLYRMLAGVLPWRANTSAEFSHRTSLAPAPGDDSDTGAIGDLNATDDVAAAASRVVSPSWQRRIAGCGPLS